MSFPGTDREIREMIPRVLLETRMARGIMRKAGVLLSVAEGIGIPSAGLLLSMHAMSNVVFDPWQWRILLREGVGGPWPAPRQDTLGWPATTQHVLIYAEGLSYVRVLLTTLGQTGAPSQNLVAFVPVYTTTMNPMSQGDLNPESLEIWTCPDGRTLYEWHLDSMAGGPKSLAWPPAGSCLYTTSVSSLFAGRWSPPPMTELSNQTSVLLGVALISRVGQDPEFGQTQKFIMGVQVQGVPDTWNTEAFQTFYAATIDE